MAPYEGRVSAVTPFRSNQRKERTPTQIFFDDNGTLSLGKCPLFA